MNCLKCPIIEECPANKLTVSSVYEEGISIPEKAVPLDIGECPLLIMISKVNELTETERKS